MGFRWPRGTGAAPSSRCGRRDLQQGAAPPSATALSPAVGQSYLLSSGVDGRAMRWRAALVIRVPTSLSNEPAQTGR